GTPVALEFEDEEEQRDVQENQDERDFGAHGRKKAERQDNGKAEAAVGKNADANEAGWPAAGGGGRRVTAAGSSRRAGRGEGYRRAARGAARNGAAGTRPRSAKAGSARSAARGPGAARRGRPTSSPR